MEEACGELGIGITAGNEQTFMSCNPNPFTGNITIEFTLNNVSDVEVAIYNQLGQLVTTLVNKKLSAGIHKAEWHAGNVPEGIYLCRIKVNDKVFTHKLMKAK